MPAAFAGAAAAALPAVAGAASLASSISNLTSGGNQPQISGAGGGAPFIYQPQFQQQADIATQPLLQQANQFGLTYGPQQAANYGTATQNITGNPYGAQYIDAANRAGAMAGIPLSYQLGGAQGLYGAGNQLLGGINPLMQAGFDPQQALYNRTLGQITDQQAAANAASGVAGPYAAGLTGDRISNFNIDWQNNQLARELMAGQGAVNLARGAGAGFAGASDLAQQAQQSQLSAGQIPYGAYNAEAQNMMNAINQQTQGYQGALGLTQAPYNLNASYLGLGQSAVPGALGGQSNAFQQQGMLGQNIASAVAPGSPLMTGLQSGINSLFGPQGTYQPPAGTDTSSQTPYNFYSGQFAGSGGY